MFFSKIDLLGVPATLNFFGNEKRKSNFGGICSIVFLVFVAWSIYNSSLDLVNRTNPNITLSEINVEDPREVNISLTDFPLAFMVQGSTAYNNNGAFINESIYTIQINHLIIERILQSDGSYKRNVTRIQLPLERCTTEHFGKYASSYSTFSFNLMYCISRNYTEQLKIQGTYTSTTFHAINGWVKMCYPGYPVNSTVTCAPQDEINKAMSGSYLDIFYIDNMMNIQNYSYPTAKYRQMYNTILNPQSYKELNIDVGLMSITTDTGFIVEDTRTETTLTVKNTKELVDLNPNLLKTLIYFYMQGSRTETYYTRSYKKIPTIMAEVGSLANAFLGIVLILISPYLRLKSREALMNEFFDFEGKQQQAQKKLRSGKSSFYETQTSKSIPKDFRMEKIPENKGLKGKWRPKDLRIATGVKTFTSEAMLSNDNFQTSPNEILESPQAKMEERPQLNSEEDVNLQILSPKDGTGQPLFSTPNQKRQSNHYSQLPLSPRDSAATVNTARRLVSESYRVTRMDGDKYEDKEFDQMMYKNEEIEEEDDMEKQLEHIDSPKLEENALNVEVVESEKVKIEVPVDSDTGNENYKRSSTEQVKEKNAADTQGKGKIAGRKGGNMVGKCFSMDKKKSSDNNELRIWEYMLSFVYKPKRLQKKITTIQQGVKNIEERLDLNNILKKFFEVDKLIALLLDRDQLELFNNMPKPQLKKWEMNHLQRQHTFEANLSKKLSNVKTMRNEDYMQQSYDRLRQKALQSDIDKRLIEIFKDEFI